MHEFPGSDQGFVQSEVMYVCMYVCTKQMENISFECRRYHYKSGKVMQRHDDSTCASTPQQICLSCFLISSCSVVTRSSVPPARLAFFTPQTTPDLEPSMNTTFPPHFWGENGARYRQRTDSWCLSFLRSVYLTVMCSLSNEKSEGHTVIH